MTHDSLTTITPPGLEKGTVEDIENAEPGTISPQSGIDAERAQLLASLPDPDAGKSEEERRAIVSGRFLRAKYCSTINKTF